MKNKTIQFTILKSHVDTLKRYCELRGITMTSWLIMQIIHLESEVEKLEKKLEEE